jgi:hypothetical protein
MSELRYEQDADGPAGAARLASRTPKGTRIILLFARLLFMALVLATPAIVIASRDNSLEPVGFPTILSGCMGIALVGYIGLEVSRMPQLLELIVDIGRQLIEFGHSQIRRCDGLIQASAERAS